MEKVPAACAMEWSIQLDKGLRSRRQGQPIEVVEEIGTKILKWSKETCITMSTSMVYGLVPGEEMSFANTVLMRFADAFRSGDNCLRVHILKIFLLELRHIKQRGRSYQGLLTKQRLPNYLELLKRVRLAYDTDDVKARALSLRLLGCWAPLTHDNADSRYLILSGLRSDNFLVVKASIFASGCLCHLSDDFACIFLGIVADILSSVSHSHSIKLAAAHAFGEIQCSALVAGRAFKSGKKLVLESQKENHIVEMLSSLSKLAVRSVILVPEQVDFLLTFLSQDCASVIKSMALKCICFLSLRGLSCSLNGHALLTLFHNIDDPDISLDQQCKILKTLHKLFMDLPKSWYYEISEFPSLVMLACNACQSKNIKKRYMALGLLVDITCNAKMMRKEHCSCTEQLSIKYVSSQADMSSENLYSVINNSVLLARYVILLLINHITSMTKNMSIGSVSGAKLLSGEQLSEAANEHKQECCILLNHILRLTVEYPVLSLMVLDRLNFLIKDLVHSHHMINNDVFHCYDISVMEIDADQSTESLESHRKKHAITEIILQLCTFIIPCLNIINKNELAGPEVCKVLTLLVDCLQKSNFCNSDACEMVSLKIQSHVMLFYCDTKEGTMQANRDSESRHCIKSVLLEDDCWFQREGLTLAFARKVLGRRKYWIVYKVGKYSTHEGLWFVATYTFRKLVDKTKSESILCWLKCLMFFAAAESELKLLLFPKLGMQLIGELCYSSNDRPHEESMEERMGDQDGRVVSMFDKRERLSRVHQRICSSQKILPADGNMAGAFWFQHWFLILRGRVFEILIDVLGHLGSHLNHEKILVGSDPEKKRLSPSASPSAEHVNLLSSHFLCVSFQLNKLAREYDFLTSFMDMDVKSSRMISRISLCCSLLAFCVGFHDYLSGFSCESITSNLGCLGNSTSMLLEDLVRRISYLYGSDVKDLERYVSADWLGGCLPSGKQIPRFDTTDRSIVSVARFAICSFQNLQQEAKSKEDICGVFQNCLQLVCDILVKWMHIPFQVPKYFFRVRHCGGAELFVNNADVWKLPAKLCVSSGNLLHLNACIQLRNISAEYWARISKIYCILAANFAETVSDGSNKRKTENLTGFQAWKTEEVLYLNEALLSYMEHETKKSYRLQQLLVKEDWITTCFSAELNGQGQGFTTCLLDVSKFPVGAYEIKWHTCCVDKNNNCWSLPALNDAVIFTVEEQSAT